MFTLLVSPRFSVLVFRTIIEFPMILTCISHATSPVADYLLWFYNIFFLLIIIKQEPNLHGADVRSYTVEKLDNQNFQKVTLFSCFYIICLLYTSPSPRDATLSRMPSSA